MHLHDLNPHVLNSLICLIGIVFSVVLIVWGMICDRRESITEEETATSRQEARACRPCPAARRMPTPTPRLSYREVA